jgi:hypothetical protein
MITQKEKARIITVLGKQYSKPILAQLQKLQITNADGGMYSNESIRQFVCGNRENLTIELEILRLVKKTETKNAALQIVRKKLISKK